MGFNMAFKGIIQSGFCGALKYNNELAVRWGRQHLKNKRPVQCTVAGIEGLTFIVRIFNSVFVLRVWNFLRDGPLNRGECLTINLYIHYEPKIMK